MNNSKYNFIEVSDLKELNSGICFLDLTTTAAIFSTSVNILSLCDLVVNECFLLFYFLKLDILKNKQRYQIEDRENREGKIKRYESSITFIQAVIVSHIENILVVEELSASDYRVVSVCHLSNDYTQKEHHENNHKKRVEELSRKVTKHGIEVYFSHTAFQQ